MIGSEPTILVIEDDADIRTTLKTVLSLSGFNPTFAEDGEEGLAAFAAAPTDALVLDVGLPGIDGWEVLRRLRRTSDVPVLILTARGLEQTQDRARACGANATMAKPFQHEELIDQLLSLLTGPTDPKVS